MSFSANLGFPRIGRRRELKFVLDQFWADKIDQAALQSEAAALRERHWRLQADLGIAQPASNDFSLYDHVLDTACMLGVVPEGYGWSGNGPVGLTSYFALARGSRGTAAERAAGIRSGLPAMEMTKWFDTNYHYLVPRLDAEQSFTLTENRPLAAFQEAKASGFDTRPVLLGPVSFLLLAKAAPELRVLDLLDDLLPIYADILKGLAEAGVDWVQVDEPMLVRDLTHEACAAFSRAYTTLAKGLTPKLMLTTYFGPLRNNLSTALALPVAGLHVDLVRGADQLDEILLQAPQQMVLSLGVVDGRNVWRTDLQRAWELVRRTLDKHPASNLVVAPSCSLLHVPIDLDQETGLAPDLVGWLAFATQKLKEVAVLGRALDRGEGEIAKDLASSDVAAAQRRAHPGVHIAGIAARLASTTAAEERRASAYDVRRNLQQERLGLPAFPTTTIGSFPQTANVRKARQAYARGTMNQVDYDKAIAGWIDQAITWQEDIDVDVLVHGEFERNDMVKYFGEQLSGYAFTQHGWVQSYGSRCVAPPIIWGDVSRPAPMTVHWSSYAQSRTKRPMKGMLTGPVTMLQWSFVRDDLPRETVCRQIALAIRDEVQDLEAAGLPIIQIDEPALREGLPLREADHLAYLTWAVACFRLCSSGVREETQIHTHMCYCEFNDIMPHIAALDADVISIETTRSRMELLDAFTDDSYPSGIGPGIWDIHSPHVPDTTEMVGLLQLARRRLKDWQIWVNPDCGLKTRGWQEVEPALANMVAAAKQLRAILAGTAD